MRTTVTHYNARKSGDAFAVVAETKSYGSLGPDPGRLEASEVRVDGVSREYAEMLARELTKASFDAKWPGDRNIFVIHTAIERNIDMWTGPNASEWADNPAQRLVY